MDLGLSVFVLLLLLTTGTAQRVRLADGPSPRKGRLEVYHSGTWWNDGWGTVCDDDFGEADARVVCYMLGYGRVGRSVGTRYGAGGGHIWLDDVRCSGRETSITDCPHNGWGSHDCEHREDVSVSCIAEVRLVGHSGSKGRLEVYQDGVWGSVCGDGFTDAAAKVVCYSLGYGRTGGYIGNHYGAGSGQIWLDRVHCDGSESHLTECRHSDWGRHNCSHSNDVSISCIADSTEAVALVGGRSPRVGRLEVFHANQWGTVCDDGFTDAAARVVCYSLGFGYVGRKVNITYYGVGDGLIWLNHTNCTGTEQHVGECSHGDWGVHNCTHHQDVAVSCTGNTSASSVRLAGGSRSTGRLEVLHSGVWGTVCNDSFNAAAASVVCKMLGRPTGTKIDNDNYASDQGPIWLDDVRCSGTETDIAECSHRGWGVHNCQHREDVAVACEGVEVEVRLNGGRDRREGRPEVFYGGGWRKICNGFNYATALVVCNMLGLGYIGRPTRTTTVNYQYYGRRRESMWLESVRCTGTEESISDCPRTGWPASSCSHDYKQTISCLAGDAVALFGGGSPREGRLEVYHNGIWGTVCSRGFSDAAARVACHSLGFAHKGQAVNSSIYGVGRRMIWLDVTAGCDGTERHIGECSHRGWGVRECGHHEDLAVSCVGGLPSTTAGPIQKPHVVNMGLIITPVVVGGLLLIICIVGVVLWRCFGAAVRCCRTPRQKRGFTAEAAATQTHVTAPSNRRSDDYELEVAVPYENPVASPRIEDYELEVAVPYENPVANPWIDNTGAPSDYQPSSTAAAADAGNIYQQVSATDRYETLPGGPRVEPVYDA